MIEKKTFILTEAAATIPLVRRILVDVRAARARQNAIHRALKSKALAPAQRHALLAEARQSKLTLRTALDEASALGVEITSGVRCEAQFPFEHRWIGHGGDNKIRPAFFIYSDAQDTIREWCFADWPADRHPPAARWWNQFRSSQLLTAAKLPSAQTAPVASP